MKALSWALWLMTASNIASDWELVAADHSYLKQYLMLKASHCAQWFSCSRQDYSWGNFPLILKWAVPKIMKTNPYLLNCLLEVQGARWHCHWSFQNLYCYLLLNWNILSHSDYQPASSKLNFFFVFLTLRSIAAVWFVMLCLFFSPFIWEDRSSLISTSLDFFSWPDVYISSWRNGQNKCVWPFSWFGFGTAASTSTIGFFCFLFEYLSFKNFSGLDFTCSIHWFRDFFTGAFWTSDITFLFQKYPVLPFSYFL